MSAIIDTLTEGKDPNKELYPITIEDAVYCAGNKTLKNKLGEMDSATSANTTNIATNASNISSLNTEMANVKKSVSDGKKSVAQAITNKGVATAADASFATMTMNIGKINTDTKHTISVDFWSGVHMNASADSRPNAGSVRVYIDGVAVWEMSSWGYVGGGGDAHPTKYNYSNNV